MQTESSAAIVLRTHVFGESDVVVSLLTATSGKLSGIAKGAKNSRRRFSGTLQTFSHIRIDWRHRAGTELVFLERAVLARPWRQLTQSLDRFAVASHVVEVADKMTAEREVGDDLFHLVRSTLERLEQAEPAPLTAARFDLAALRVAGVAPDFARCERCRCELAGDRLPARISPARGAVLCRGCASPGDGGAILSRAVLEVLRSAPDVSRGAELWAGEGVPGDVAPIAQSEELSRALTVLLQPHLRSRLRTLETLGATLSRPLAAAGRYPES